MEQLEVAHRFVELWYAPERETELRSLLADGYLHHAPRADLDAEQFIGQLAYLNAALSDIDYRVLHAVADGEIVAVYVTAEATHTGDFFGAPATGKRVSTAGACFLRVGDGRIAEDWDAWALHTILVQPS
jgi:steroid delta-isomerase-like uncharacterized protein